MAEQASQILRYSTSEPRTQNNQPKWRINCSHILVQDPALARQIIDWITETVPENQHACFENLAAMYSECGSCLNYGNIGWIEPGMTHINFERALCCLRPGQWFPDPVGTDWGWHVIARVE